VVSIDWDGSDAGLKFSKEAKLASAREAGSVSRVSADGAAYCSWPDRLLPTELAMAEHRL